MQRYDPVHKQNPNPNHESVFLLSFFLKYKSARASSVARLGDISLTSSLYTKGTGQGCETCKFIGVYYTVVRNICAILQTADYNYT